MNRSSSTVQRAEKAVVRAAMSLHNRRCSIYTSRGGDLIAALENACKKLIEARKR